ncbi:uncharacterized protein LTR77_008039 [Saxophila tyrrhenica]|uniref:Major facilitator superfamily (MFS) profile domain-containing protein n=1 Tax=Saxophila tyrrhenica TaxID=1690608 RepID=A0AAV9P4H1_9PEZI|nr:hypothetical protein LTR77_008039 [Saxophila tyrrhenica]
MPGSMIDEKDDQWEVEEREGSLTTANSQERLPLWKAIKKYWIITGWTFGLTLGILLWGYDLVIVGVVASLPAFQEKFGEAYEDRFIIPAAWLSAWAVSTNIGLMAGAVLTGQVQDRIGRKWTLNIMSVICSVSVAICYVSDLPTTPDGRRGVYFVAKTVQGFSIGGIMTTIQTWLSEVLPTDLRGPFMAVFPIFKLLGQLVGAVVSLVVVDYPGSSSYRVCFATQWPFSALLTILTIFLPESPAWLLRKGKDDAAKSGMNRLRGRKGNNAELAYNQLRETVEAEKEGDHISKESYLACFKQPHLRRTFIVAFAEVIPLFFGLQLLGSASYFLQQIGMDSETSLLLQVIGIAIGVIASCVTFYTSSKFGRRVLILTGLAGISVMWFGIGLSGIWQNEGAMWFTAIGMLLVLFLAGSGPWPASYAVASEASAICLRAKTQGIGWFTYGLGTLVFGVVMPYLYNPDAANLGSYTAFVYFAIAAIGVTITFFCVPEMKGRTAKQIDAMFEARLPTRKFRSWEENEGVGPQQ